VNSDRDWVLKVDQVAPILKQHSISTIYTGSILAKEGFLGITAESDPDDPIYRTVLSNYSIAEFEESGIHVVKLEQMI